MAPPPSRDKKFRNNSPFEGAGRTLGSSFPTTAPLNPKEDATLDGRSQSLQPTSSSAAVRMLRGEPPLNGRGQSHQPTFPSPSPSDQSNKRRYGETVDSGDELDFEDCLSPRQPARRRRHTRDSDYHAQGSPAPRATSNEPFGGLYDGETEGEQVDEAVRNFNPPIATPAFGRNVEVPKDRLDNYQNAVFDEAVLQRKNLCIIGQAGTGKTTLVLAIIAMFCQLSVRVQVVAATGTAALNTHGSTIHSFFGLGGNTRRSIASYKNMLPTIRARLRNVHVLIIDEISMVSRDMFRRMNVLLQAAMGNTEPFGGIQLIVVGDFCQLPPVNPFETCFECGNERKHDFGTVIWRCSLHGEVNEREQWAFRCAEWDQVGFQYVLLEQNHRQNEMQLSMLLDKQWHGHMFTREDIEVLSNPEANIRNAVRLFCKNNERKAHNSERFLRLRGREYKYQCQDSFECHHRELEYLGRYDWGNRHVLSTFSQHHAYEDLARLKVGMPVILLLNMNIDRGLVNGSQGVISGFHRYHEAEIPRPQYQTRWYSPEEEETTSDYVPPQGGSHISLRHEKSKGSCARTTTHPCRSFALITDKSSSSGQTVAFRSVGPREGLRYS